jgi:hypothetical protein
LYLQLPKKISPNLAHAYRSKIQDHRFEILTTTQRAFNTHIEAEGEDDKTSTAAAAELEFRVGDEAPAIYMDCEG